MLDRILDLLCHTDAANRELGKILLTQELSEEAAEAWIREQFAFDFFEEKLRYLVQGDTWREQLESILLRSTYLRLEGCDLVELPAILGRLPFLMDLDLRDNPRLDFDPVFRTIAPLAASKKIIWVRTGGSFYGAPTDGSYLILRLHRRQFRLPESIGLLRHLEWLDLSGMGLEELPETFWSLSELRYLNLSYNRFRHLPDRLNELSRLEWLLLYNKHLFQLPKSIGQLPFLKNLGISNQIPLRLPFLSELAQQNRTIEIRSTEPADFFWRNILTPPTVPATLLLHLENQTLPLPAASDLLPLLHTILCFPSSISQLTEQDFSRAKQLVNVTIQGAPTQATPLSSALFHAPNLHVLHLYVQDSTPLPETVGRLTHLRHLYIRNERLHGLPASFQQLSALEQLSLSCPFVFSGWDIPTKKLTPKSLMLNRLDWLPEHFGDYFSAERLEVFVCSGLHRLVEFPDAIFDFLEKAENLQQITLRQMRLRCFPQAILSCRQLQTLHIELSPGVQIPDEITQLTHLREVQLRYESGMQLDQERIRGLLPSGCTFNCVPID